MAIDAMRVGDQHYFTQVGIRLDALMIRDTSREDKKRYGRIATLTAATHLLGFQPQRFGLVVDGARHRRASQVVIANCGILASRRFAGVLISGPTRQARHLRRSPKRCPTTSCWAGTSLPAP